MIVVLVMLKKGFIKLTPRVNYHHNLSQNDNEICIYFLIAKLSVASKLECLFLASFSSLV